MRQIYIAVSINEDLLRKVEGRAEYEHRDRNQYIINLLEKATACYPSPEKVAAIEEISRRGKTYDLLQFYNRCSTNELSEWQVVDYLNNLK